ncbi:GAF domain-containing protein [bacterium]|nr:GAF domain-containing protein [bacterium]
MKLLPQPTSAEVVACTPDGGWSVGMRLPIDKLPAVLRIPHEKIVTINDTQDQSWLDPVTAATLEANGARSFAVVPLLLNARYVAVLYFQSDEPRLYSDREKRLMAGMGDLVLAAIERVRLQAETELARQHAVMIAQSNAALSQAKNEQDILAAVAPIAEQCGVALSVLAYTDHTRRLEIVALRSRDGSSPIPLQFLPITKFSLDDYPVLDLAYIYPDEPLFH